MMPPTTEASTTKIGAKNVIQADVAIIGAGPAGTATAIALSQLGVNDVLLVDKHDFPRDKTCGSGISPKGIAVLKHLGVWPEVEREAMWIRGMRLVTPRDQEGYLSAGPGFDAIICKRRVLDHLLLKRAQQLGVRFMPYCTATELLEQNDRVLGFRSRQGHEVRARYTVVAGGTHCLLGLQGRPEPKRLIQAIMGWWEGVPYREGSIEMIFDNMVSPYYGWLFPETDRVVNIGITYEDIAHRTNGRALFQRFLDKHYAARLVGATQIGKWQGHPIAYEYQVGRLTSPGRVVVGEAGRMTHPATAEGIYQGMQSGTLAARALHDMLSGRHSERIAFNLYEWRCRTTFGPSFVAGGMFRRLVRTSALDWVVRASRNTAVQSLTAKVLAWM